MLFPVIIFLTLQILTNQLDKNDAITVEEFKRKYETEPHAFVLLDVLLVKSFNNYPRRQFENSPYPNVTNYNASKISLLKSEEIILLSKKGNETLEKHQCLENIKDEFLKKCDDEMNETINPQCQNYEITKPCDKQLLQNSLAPLCINKEHLAHFLICNKSTTGDFCVESENNTHLIFQCKNTSQSICLNNEKHLQFCKKDLKKKNIYKLNKRISERKRNLKHLTKRQAALKGINCEKCRVNLTVEIDEDSTGIPYVISVIQSLHNTKGLNYKHKGK